MVTTAVGNDVAVKQPSEASPTVNSVALTVSLITLLVVCIVVIVVLVLCLRIRRTNTGFITTYVWDVGF